MGSGAAAAGGLVGVDVLGWGEPGHVGVDGDEPVVAVDFVVVCAAEQYSVVQVGCSSL